MTVAPDPNRLQGLIERLAAEPGRTAILTDVDGTIAPITARPDETAVPASARRALRALAERFALVGCISGRRASEARGLVGVDGITYSGNHGMETLDPGSSEAQMDLNLRGHADAAASLLDRLDLDRAEQLGVRREDKGPIQALHWRGAPSEDDARKEAERLAVVVESEGLEAHWGRKVLEVRPPGGGGKGAAIASLLGGQDLALAVYAGDDRTDIDAFRRLRELAAETGSPGEGLCVGILSTEGPIELEAESDVALSDPDEWIEVLGALGG